MMLHFAFKRANSLPELTPTGNYLHNDIKVKNWISCSWCSM